jgi:hypothetical protein
LPLAALKTSLALWRRRYNARLKLRAVARQDVLEARDADVHPRRALVDRQILREQQTQEALDRIRVLERKIAAKQRGRVRRPFERVKMDVACQSSRDGARPRLIVLHDTEGGNIPGVQDLRSLGEFFDRITTQASSNVGVDAEGISARYVKDGAKAWAQAAFNPQSLSIEQIGFASQTVWPAAQLRKTAQYVAYWAVRYEIPLEHSTEHGVCQHSDLGVAGGGHRDCGPRYPFGQVLAMAREFATEGW